MNYENLIVGDFPLQKETVTIGGNQELKAGCVLGRKTITAGAKGKFSFALTSLTADDGTVSATIDGETYSVDTTSESTIDSILTALAAGINADSTCAFAASADTSADKLVLEAKAVGAFANSITISMAKTGDIVLTIGSKTTVTSGADASSGEFYAVNSGLSDGTQFPRAVLLEDVTVANGSTGKALVAFTGVFNKSKLTFGSTDTWATHADGMRDRCMFAVDVVEK